MSSIYSLELPPKLPGCRNTPQKLHAVGTTVWISVPEARHSPAGDTDNTTILIMMMTQYAVNLYGAEAHKMRRSVEVSKEQTGLIF